MRPLGTLMLTFALSVLSVACSYLAYGQSDETVSYQNVYNAFVNGIDEAHIQDQNGQYDQAERTLYELKPSLVALTDLVTHVVRRDGVFKDQWKDQAAQQEKRIGEENTTVLKLDKEINTRDVSISGLEKTIQKNGEQIETHRANIADADAERAKLLKWMNDNAAKAAIPFYGIHIAVEYSKAESKREQLRTTRNTWARDTNKLLKENDKHQEDLNKLKQQQQRTYKNRGEAVGRRQFHEKEKRKFDTFWVEASARVQNAGLIKNSLNALDLNDSPSLLKEKLQRPLQHGKPGQLNQALASLVSTGDQLAREGTISQPHRISMPFNLNKLNHNTVNGWSITRVDFVNNDGEPNVFQQDSELGAWSERNVAGQVIFTFNETHREEWKVELTDSARGMKLLFDLKALEVFYKAVGEPSFKALYPITNATSTVVGARKQLIDYRSTNSTAVIGTFRGYGEQWVEYGNGTAYTSYKQIGGDDSSIVLMGGQHYLHFDLNNWKLKRTNTENDEEKIFLIAAP